MTLTLYRCNNHRNRIDKTLENGLDLTGTMKNSLDVDTISVDVAGYEPVSFDYNYCYIPELKRYYFIGTPIVLPNGVITLPLECDVLMSFKSSIENIIGTVGTEQGANPYFSGYDTAHDVRPNTEKYEFENNFNEDGNIIMVTLRGVG